MAFREKPFSPSFPINLAVVTSSVQAIAGVIIWKCLDYLQPNLQWFNLAVLAWYLLGAASGFLGARIKSESIMWLYSLHIGTSLALAVLIICDSAGLIPLISDPLTYTVPDQSGINGTQPMDSLSSTATSFLARQPRPDYRKSVLSSSHSTVDHYLPNGINLHWVPPT